MSRTDHELEGGDVSAAGERAAHRATNCSPTGLMVNSPGDAQVPGVDASEAQEQNRHRLDAIQTPVFNHLADGSRTQTQTL